jgi:hexosaminidase
MNKRFLLILWGLMATFGTKAQQQESIHLIPKPVELQIQIGLYYPLTAKSTLSYNKPEVQKIADLFLQKINTPTGLSIRASQGKMGAIQLNLNDTPNPQLGKEGYTLESTVKGVVITANQTAGLYYGTLSLMQLLPKNIESKIFARDNWDNWKIPVVKITDYPRFGWRGLMLDVSRNFFTKQEVKRYIDQLSKLKMNVFHWHLTDDNGWRIEIKSLPKLTQVGAWRVARTGHFGDRANPKDGEAATVGGYYTQEDIKEIVAFAQERNVTIVPEIDVPGHSMAAIAAYPELSTLKDASTKVNPGTNFADWYGNGTFKMNIENTLNPADEKVYDFLDKVFGEVAALFPSTYIHVGGDESYHGYWAQDAGCQALMKKLKTRHVADLQGYFMSRLEKILESKGKRLIGWNEILEGDLSPKSAVMSWQGVKGGIEAAHLGHEVVMTPSTHTYLDYNQGDATIDPPIYASLRMKKCYSFEPVPEGVDAKYILGGQGNLWSEQTPHFRHVEYMTYPRAWALSEVYWSPKSAKNWEDFVARVETHFDRADVAEINYSKSMYDAIIKTIKKNGKTMIELDTEVPDLDIHYTLDDSMPDKFSPKYSQPVELPDGPMTLRVITCRGGKPIGHLITLGREALEKRK